jgi:RNA polymerase sigma-70 factor (ECF subfamily)
VQDVFLAIWTGREHWHVRTSLRAYLRRAVHNVSARTAGSRSRGWSGTIGIDDAEWTAPSLFVDEAANPDAHVERMALAEAVERATGALPPRARDVFTMSRAHRLSNREIAAKLGVSVKTVETHMTRALSSLRRRLAAWRD